MSKQSRSIAALASILTFAGAVIAAQSSATKIDTYTWSGELVSLDPTAKTITVKSRVVYQDALPELKQFKAGDRVWLVWSGLHSYSDGVRQIRRPGTGGRIDEDLVLPAELVSTEAPNQYITIRVKVPESSVSAVKPVKPGEWVTVTARHRPSTDDDAVVAVAPYASTTTTTTTD
jgi:hypothetical protein